VRARTPRLTPRGSPGGFRENPSFSPSPPTTSAVALPATAPTYWRHWWMQGFKTLLWRSMIPRRWPRLAGARPGEMRSLAIGGRGPPHLADGRMRAHVEFVLAAATVALTLEDANSHLALHVREQVRHGTFVPSCGMGGVTILLTSNKTPPFDLGQWRSQGIEPEKLSVIAVKAACRATGGCTTRSPGPITWWKTTRPVFEQLENISVPECPRGPVVSIG